MFDRHNTVQTQSVVSVAVPENATADLPVKIVTRYGTHRIRPSMVLHIAHKGDCETLRIKLSDGEVIEIPHVGLQDADSIAEVLFPDISPDRVFVSEAAGGPVR
ncbi:MULTISPECIES: hypothetical protein [Stenotrophomonas]|uniref:hypothetical protein n=1 Tax=Stenotrophomonas TaxID=40323 RepID=UPI0021C9686F|nr:MULTISPECIES: hypothetical protein [Stenotrophomonas]MCU1136754.1 hypothetical protein [Stenotrophomonas maltophilia]MEC4339908.1 hypothetical protein [Stenotrophomonas pavanii]